MKQTRSCFVPGLIPVLLAAAQLFIACAGQGETQVSAENGPGFTGIPVVAANTTGNNVRFRETGDSADAGKIRELLDQMAELERSGLYRPGMAVAESGLWERLGDYGSAAVAAYKEMSWAYGRGEITLEHICEGLERVIALENQQPAPGYGSEAAVHAARAILAFVQGNSDDAVQKLTALFGNPDEPDSFVNWMLLACALEKEPSDRKTVSAYRSIRARYAQFPEYWYRGAKAFSGLISAEFAEHCISLAPDGPFSAECRGILASNAGLKAEDGPSIKSKSEIEGLISRAVNTGNPALLESLMPLIALPENPYTVYAIGALKPLAAIPSFRDYFDKLASQARGRLADRLVYICRG
jgi:hypothetical protein